MLNSSSTQGLVLQRGTPEYNENRSLYFNKDETNRFPAEIHVVQSTQDVSNALRRAREINAPVGVRSGGHLPSKPSLVHGGILIDVSRLNRGVTYDSHTLEASFGPAVRVYEAWNATDALGRFFPFGHAPDVALGGFCLAGGQGFFMRGWGPTITDWIVKLEVVVPDGRVLIASRTENRELFWAARGAGQAFFGVVTRIWSRTIPKRKLFGRSFTFRVEDGFEDLLSFAFERNSAMPRTFTETAVCTLHKELFDTTSGDESIASESPLLLMISVSAYADDLTQASALTSVWDQVPDNVKEYLVEAKPMAETSWNEFFQLQHVFNPPTADHKWSIHSILNDPSVPQLKLIETIKPALCNLPTRSSWGCIYMCDSINLDENDAVMSVPQQYYISTFAGWKDPALRPQIQEIMRESYQKAESVACGIYIADFDQSADSLHSPTIPVWTESARSKFMKIRQKWDPHGLFAGYKAFTVGMKEKTNL